MSQIESEINQQEPLHNKQPMHETDEQNPTMKIPATSAMQFTSANSNHHVSLFVFLQGWLCLWLFTTTKPGLRMTSASGRGRGSRSSTARKCENICMTALRVAAVFSLSVFSQSRMLHLETGMLFHRHRRRKRDFIMQHVTSDRFIMV